MILIKDDCIKTHELKKILAKINLNIVKIANYYFKVTLKLFYKLTVVSSYLI